MHHHTDRCSLVAAQQSHDRSIYHHADGVAILLESADLVVVVVPERMDLSVVHDARVLLGDLEVALFRILSYQVEGALSFDHVLVKVFALGKNLDERRRSRRDLHHSFQPGHTRLGSNPDHLRIDRSRNPRIRFDAHSRRSCHDSSPAGMHYYRVVVEVGLCGPVAHCNFGFEVRSDSWMEVVET